MARDKVTQRKEHANAIEERWSIESAESTMLHAYETHQTSTPTG